jgi:hypothetical protein
MSRYRSTWKRKNFVQGREILTTERHDYLVYHVYPLHDSGRDKDILSFTDYYKRVFHSMGLKGKPYDLKMRRIYYLRDRQRFLDQGKEWAKNNPDKKKAHRKNYVHRHKRKLNKRARIRYYINRDKMLIKNKRWRDNHKDVCAGCAKDYYARNKERVLNHKKEYYVKNRGRILKQKRDAYEAKMNTYYYKNRVELLRKAQEKRDALKMSLPSP